MKIHLTLTLLLFLTLLCGCGEQSPAKTPARQSGAPAYNQSVKIRAEMIETRILPNKGLMGRRWAVEFKILAIVEGADSLKAGDPLVVWVGSPVRFTGHIEYKKMKNWTLSLLPGSKWDEPVDEKNVLKIEPEDH